MASDRTIKITLFVLLSVSFLLRAFIAGIIELGNDEVYYWTYAKFPDLSHFDHPPMVGLLIQASTLDLRFESEFFIRLGSVILGTASTFMMFLIGKQIRGPLTGLYAAMLFTASFYGFVLSGTFILPDTPQVFFWLTALWFLSKALPDRELSPASRRSMIFAGLFIGLAFLSKYHSVFLLGGAFFYILLYNRRWFLAWESYGAFLVFGLLTLPVVFWNMQNDFISFTFHENRIGILDGGLKPQYFLTEAAGQFFYNNPVNVILIIFTLVLIARGRSFLERDYSRLILLTSLPLILVFLLVALFRPTLPHWTGPGYLGLILLVASWLSEPKSDFRNPRLVPWQVTSALGFLMLVLVLAVGQIRLGWIPIRQMGGDDVTHDLAGWDQLGRKFAPLAREAEKSGAVRPGSPILTFRWFPAANFDYYVGRRSHKAVYATGTLERIHKYHWINGQRGDLKRGSDAWYIGLSDDYEDPVALYGEKYRSVIPVDTLVITRGKNDTVRKAFIYSLKGLREDWSFRRR